MASQRFSFKYGLLVCLISLIYDACSFDISGNPYLPITSLTVIPGRIIVTFSVLLTKRTISGYSLPVLQKTAFISLLTNRRTMSSNTVESLPPEKET